MEGGGKHPPPSATPAKKCPVLIGLNKVLERQNLKIRFPLAYLSVTAIISVVTQKLSKFL